MTWNQYNARKSIRCISSDVESYEVESNKGEITGLMELHIISMSAGVYYEK